MAPRPGVPALASMSYQNPRSRFLQHDDHVHDHQQLPSGTCRSRRRRPCDTTETNVDTPLTAAQCRNLFGNDHYAERRHSRGGHVHVLRCAGMRPTRPLRVRSPQVTRPAATRRIRLLSLRGDLIDVRVQRTAGAGSLTTTFNVQLARGPSLEHVDCSRRAGIAAPGGTSGIIVDNTVSGGGSQIYYSTRTSPGIAVQASQAALQ